MAGTREIEFAYKCDFLGLHAYSQPTFFGLHPRFATNEAKHFLITLDLKHVKTSQATGVVQAEKICQLCESLGIKNEDGFLMDEVRKGALILKECLRCVRVTIKEATEDPRPVQKRLSREQLRSN